MLNFIISVVITVAVFGLIIRYFTGNKILDLTYRCALLRLLAGIMASLFPIFWWGLTLFDAFP